jgi:hypothetical protein
MGSRGLSIHALLQKIGPEHTKYEFWEALRFYLNRDIFTWRDQTTQVLMLTFDQSEKKEPLGWYEYERKGDYGGVMRFCIPPISLIHIRKALLKPPKAEVHTLRTVTKQVIAAYPELNLFDEEQVITDIVAPALFSRHQR